MRGFSLKGENVKLEKVKSCELSFRKSEIWRPLLAGSLPPTSHRGDRRGRGGGEEEDLQAPHQPQLHHGALHPQQVVHSWKPHSPLICDPFRRLFFICLAVIEAFGISAVILTVHWAINIKVGEVKTFQHQLFICTGWGDVCGEHGNPLQLAPHPHDHLPHLSLWQR